MVKRYTRREILDSAGRISILSAGGSALTGMYRGWLPDGLSDIADTAAKAMRYADSVKKGVDATRKAMEDFTPEQEYYIGRTVGAVVVSRYKPYNNQEASLYLNIVGQTLARASDLPETFNGYHMLILDSREINAFATPAGHIFVTRGMLGCCRNEGELAAVLAHEIGHVQHRHGIDAIEKNRITEAGTIIGTEAIKTFAESDIANLTAVFEDSINDITTTMITNGYSRSFEREADKSAVSIMERIGYNPQCLIAMLEVMATKLEPGSLDFAKTHPSPQSRIEDLRNIISTAETPSFSDVQKERFQAAMKQVL